MGLFPAGAPGRALKAGESGAAGSMSGFDVEEWLGAEYRSRGLTADIVAINPRVVP